LLRGQISTATNIAGKPIKVGSQPQEIAVTPDEKTIYVIDDSNEIARDSGAGQDSHRHGRQGHQGWGESPIDRDRALTGFARQPVPAGG
jgi:hypothetical protein